LSVGTQKTEGASKTPARNKGQTCLNRGGHPARNATENKSGGTKLKSKISGLSTPRGTMKKTKKRGEDNCELETLRRKDSLIRVSNGKQVFLKKFSANRGSISVSRRMNLIEIVDDHSIKGALTPSLSRIIRRPSPTKKTVRNADDIEEDPKKKHLLQCWAKERRNKSKKVRMRTGWVTTSAKNGLTARSSRRVNRQNVPSCSKLALAPGRRVGNK